MPASKPHHGNCTGSNVPRATTANFCLAVSGGTLPPFSRLKKFGRAKRSRSFEVPAVLPWPVASWVFLSLLCGPGCTAAGAWPGAGVCACDCSGESGLDDGVLCWAALSDGKRMVSAKHTVSLAANLINNDLPHRQVDARTGMAISFI